MRRWSSPSPKSARATCLCMSQACRFSRKPITRRGRSTNPRSTSRSARGLTRSENSKPTAISSTNASRTGGARIFRSRAVSGGNLAQLLMVAGMLGFQFIAAQYLQNSLGYPPAVAGLAMLPIPLVIAAVSLTVAGRLIGRERGAPLEWELADPDCPDDGWRVMPRSRRGSSSCTGPDR